MVDEALTAEAEPRAPPELLRVQLLYKTMPSLAEGGHFLLYKEEVKCTRLIRGLIVALLFRQVFEVLHGFQGLEAPAFHALHSLLVNGSRDCGSVAPLAG